MTAYVIRRLLVTPFLLIAVSFIVFGLIRSVPGDPAEALLGEKGSAEVLAEIRKTHGLDKPMVEQYRIYMTGVVFRGDFGRSYVHHIDVTDEIKRYLPATIELTCAAMAISLIFGVGLGVIAAVKKGTWVDYLSSVIALIGVSVPVYWLGLLLLIAFGKKLGASSGNLPVTLFIERPTGFVLIDTLIAGEGFGAACRHLILPAIALSTIPVALIARITRSSMLDVLESDYVRTARAKGVAPWKVVMVHAFRNALIPIVTLAGLEFGYLLGGAVLTETVFTWPGMGTWIVKSVQDRDYPAIQAAVITLATTFVLVNLLVDILYAFIDPRIRYG